MKPKRLRGNRGDNMPEGATKSARVFSRSSHDGGQEERIRSSRKHTGGTVNRLLCLGCIAHVQGMNNAGAVIWYLTRKGCVDVMNVANMYRKMKELRDAGFLENNEDCHLLLTESGRQACPDKEEFLELVDTKRRINEIVNKIENARRFGESL